jgi:hypothetical protein
MKLKILFLALFVAGIVASMAVAKPPPGHGNPHGRNGDAGSTAAGPTAASTTTTATLPSSGKVVLCHRTGSKNHPWVKISVNVHAARQRLNKGDQLAGADGSCAGAAGTTTTGTTTTDTTTAATTTDTTATTTVATTTTSPTTTTTP